MSDQLTEWTCPTCGSHRVPDDWVKVREEWNGLTDRERDVAREILSIIHLHGLPDHRPWVNCTWSILRGLLPSIDGERADVRDAGSFLPLFDDEEEEVSQ